ncbi:hypothetical protein [Arenicella xantha]|uniref:Uncharacterized protein n=1 Tax=Arenicella xantha TaxID=644221 RepID=A0A395JJR2_9GAMM|nr:hypothetical protein [Arenicella xantha]RBP44678.1 hypothetical protein DFR28_1281 [Arenicella xantha]
MSNGIAINLENKFAFNEDSVLIYTTHGCKVILQGDVDDGDNHYFIILEFFDVISVRSAATDCTPAFNIDSKKVGVSFVAELTNSQWDDEAHLSYTYTGTKKITNRKHFVVTNHDVFHEVLGKSFVEQKISRTSKDYQNIRLIYLYAKAQIL